MAQHMAIFLVLILAALYPDYIASPVDDTSNAQDATLLSTKVPNMVTNQTRLEKRINNKFTNLELRSQYLDEFVKPQISQRNNGTDEILCRTRKRIINPSEDEQYKWLEIQDIKGKPAGLLVEECLNPGESCGQFFSLTVPKGVTATCGNTGMLARYHVTAQDVESGTSIIKPAGTLQGFCRCVLKRC